MSSPDTGALSRIMRHSDLLAAVGIMVVVAMLIVPLPPALLDLFITINIAGAIAVVVATLYLKHALDLSVFPSLLLLSTIFRLAINVSVTRLVLSEGEAGAVVHAFGEFVIGRGHHAIGERGATEQAEGEAQERRRQHQVGRPDHAG